MSPYVFGICPTLELAKNADASVMKPNTSKPVETPAEKPAEKPSDLSLVPRFSPEVEAEYLRDLEPDIRRFALYFGAAVFALPQLFIGVFSMQFGFANISLVGLAVASSQVALGAAVLLTRRYTQHVGYHKLLAAFVVATVVSCLLGTLAPRSDAKVVSLECARLLILTMPFMYLNLRVKQILSIPLCIAFGVIALTIYPSKVGVILSTIGMASFNALSFQFLERHVRRIFFLKTQVSQEKLKSEGLLRNIFPGAIFDRIKGAEKPTFVQKFDDVSVLFADLVGFTRFASENSADEVVAALDQVFSRLDATCVQVGAVKVKTIGDAYLAVAGLPVPSEDHIFRMAELALEFREAIKKYSILTGQNFNLRIGLHAGPVVAGIIGKQTIQFDVWGDTVNFASRLESQGVVGEIQVSQEVARRLQARYELVERGSIEIKGRGPAKTYLLLAPRAESSRHEPELNVRSVA